MKKKIKKLAVGCMASILLFTGCNNVTDEINTSPLENYTPIEHDAQYYDNYQFNQYYNPEQSAEHLPNQGIYGSGNAYILRYNGMYYMYMGSSNTASSSLPCWESEDLMTWKLVNNGVNSIGTIAEDPRLFNCYPPCVRQYNGTFYMYIYIKNNAITQGNYILTAPSPIGPFDFVTDENGEPICYTIAETTLNIDCDIFIDDNEDVYFMSAHQDNYFTGIRAFKMPTMDSVSYDDGSYINIANSSVGGWTEGNGIFKRNGNYYLMYTGSNILSPGYLTHYSTAIGDSWKKAFGTEQKVDAPGFVQGIDWPMGCETDPKFYSLGHATSVLGPDMDGLYYHYFSVNSAGPNATFAIDRLIFNGTGMDSAQAQFHSVTPKRPAIYSYNPAEDSAFEKSSGKLLSKASSSSVFTAEFNFVSSSAKCVVGYVDDNNYAYVKTDVPSKKVGLYVVNQGVEREVASGSIVRSYDKEGLLQTVRVAYRDGKVDVYFDDLLKIENANATISAGKIGYIYSGELTSGYVACSNVAKGLSDAVEPKQSFINIGAESYLPTGVYEGHGSSFNSSKAGFSTVDANEYAGAQLGLGTMTLSSASDSASYIVDFASSRLGGNTGYYALQMTFNKKYAGKHIGVRVDGGEMMIVKMPEVNPSDESDIVKATIAEIPVEKGVREISFYGVGQEVAFHSFTFVESVSSTFTYSAKLDEAPATGMEQLSLWRIEKSAGDSEASLTSREGARSLVFFGGKGLINYTVECDFRLNSESIYTAGFIIHGARYSNSAYVTEDYKFMQGYYVALNKRMVKLEKLNYTHTDSNAGASRCAMEIGVWHHARIEVKGNSITVTITSASGQSTTLNYTDSIILGGGRFGFYSGGASMSYRNLSIKG